MIVIHLDVMMAKRKMSLNELSDKVGITLANLSPSGLANIAAEGMHPVENIYIIEENVYEEEDPYECYCSVNSGHQS